MKTAEDIYVYMYVCMHPILSLKVDACVNKTQDAVVRMRNCNNPAMEGLNNVQDATSHK